jgi:hypothetical protein
MTAIIASLYIDMLLMVTVNIRCMRKNATRPYHSLKIVTIGIITLLYIVKMLKYNYTLNFSYILCVWGGMFLITYYGIPCRKCGDTCDLLAAWIATNLPGVFFVLLPLFAR